MSYEAILFDLDGTLADTLTDLGLAMNEALGGLGCPAHPIDAYRHFVGDGVRVLCGLALPTDRQDLIPRAVEAMRHIYARTYMDHTVLYDGVADLLEQLGLRGTPLGILSNKPDDFTVLMVRDLGIMDRFGAVRGLREGVPRKPAPDGALAIAEAIGVAPGRFLYVGDTATDMRTARAAGMVPIGVLWGFRDREELESAGAEHIVSAPAEIMRILCDPAS